MKKTMLATATVCVALTAALCVQATDVEQSQLSQPAPGCAGRAGNLEHVGGPEHRDRTVADLALLVGRWTSGASALTLTLGMHMVGDTFEETLVGSWRFGDGRTIEIGSGHFNSSTRLLTLEHIRPRGDPPLRFALTPDGQTLRDMTDGRSELTREGSSAPTVLFSPTRFDIVRTGGASATLDGETARMCVPAGGRSRVRLTARETLGRAFEAEVAFRLAGAGADSGGTFVCVGVVNTAKEYWDPYRYVTGGRVHRDGMSLLTFEGFYNRRIGRFQSMPGGSQDGRLRILYQNRRFTALLASDAGWTTIGTQGIDLQGDDVRLVLVFGTGLGAGPYRAADLTLSDLRVASR